MNADTNGKAEVAQEIEEQELCTQCMTDNCPGDHFCRKCGAPLSSYAATGPFESLFAEGHVYRRATEQPQRLIVLLGVWLIFGSVALAGAMIAATSRGFGHRFGLPLGVGLFSISLFLIAKTTKNYRKRRITVSEDNG